MASDANVSRNMNKLGNDAPHRAPSPNGTGSGNVAVAAPPLPPQVQVPGNIPGDIAGGNLAYLFSLFSTEPTQRIDRTSPDVTERVANSTQNPELQPSGSAGSLSAMALAQGASATPLVRPGVALSGYSCVYNRHENPEIGKNSLEVTPITLYKSFRGDGELGDLICVNENYICYPIRGGLIRLINQASASKVLLRQHEFQTVMDLAFFNHDTNLLLSSGSDDNINIWSIFENAGEDDMIHHEVIKRVSSPAQRVIWHPTDYSKIALVNRDVIRICDMSSIDASGSRGVESYSAACQDPSDSTQINDICFSRDGGQLVSVSAGGNVRVWDTASVTHPRDVSCLKSFQSHSGRPVNYCGFISADTLCLGGEGNSNMCIWKVPAATNQQPQKLQSLRIVSGDIPVETRLKLDSTNRFLFIADQKEHAVYVAHLTNERFDNITEFKLTSSILTMTVLNCGVDRGGCDGDISPSLATGSDEMQLFCVQEHAIQQQHVMADQCFIPPADTNAASLLPIRSAVPERAITPVSVTHSDNTPSQTVGTTTTEGMGALSFQHVQQPNEQPSSEGAAANLKVRNPEDVEVKTHVAIPTNGELHQPPPQAVEGGTAVKSDDMVERIMTRLEAMQEQQQKQLNAMITRTIASQIDTAVKREVETVIVPAMGRILLHTMERKFLKPVHIGFNKMITEKLIPSLEARIENLVETRVPKQVEAGLSGVSTAVSEQVRIPVRESFRECFQDVIIPSFQAATQKMFEQINDTFVNGISAVAQEAESQGQVARLIDQITQMLETMKSMERRLEAMEASGGFLQGGGSDAIKNAPLADVEDELTEEGIARRLQGELQKLLTEQEYEDALEKALSAENLAAVVFVCSRIQSKNIFGSRPPKLPQIFILCLIQQLASGLTECQELKISWIQDALLVLDVNDSTIEAHVEDVLRGVQSNLDIVTTGVYKASGASVLQHIVKSMLSVYQ